MRSVNQNQIENKKCPNCGYDCSESPTACDICNTPLSGRQKIQRVGETDAKKRLTKRIPGNVLLLSKKVRDVIQVDRNRIYREVNKPANLLGLFAIALGLVLWFNHLFVIKPSQVQVKEKDSGSENIRGLVSYGGAGIFAPLVGSGIHGIIEQKFPGYFLRYTKPLDDNYSSFGGVRMLIDGELSFAYNERTLSDGEFTKANLRSTSLKQIPIAIDGVVIFGNKEIEVDRLNREQISSIFKGEITNWNQIYKTEDLPIIPVVVEDEDLRMVGINNTKDKDLATATEHVDNYTQSLRKIISTPGAISFASGTIAKNQQLIKMFALADGSSNNYISPTTVDGKLNTASFRSGEYPLTRRIFIVHRQDGTFDEKAAKLYIDYLLSPEGQNKVSEVGLVPIAN